MRRRTAVAWGLLAILLIGLFVVPSIWKSLMLEWSASTPLSKAIVTTLHASPKGFTDVSGELCNGANEETLATAVKELWPLDAGIVFDKSTRSEGMASASFTMPNAFFEGVQTLWFDVDDETDYCLAKIQTYSW